MFGKNSAISLKKKLHFFFDLRSSYTFLCTHPVVVIYYSFYVFLHRLFTMKLDMHLENVLAMY